MYRFCTTGYYYRNTEGNREYRCFTDVEGLAMESSDGTLGRPRKRPPWAHFTVRV